jgi:beta-lactamase class A
MDGVSPNPAMVVHKVVPRHRPFRSVTKTAPRDMRGGLDGLRKTVVSANTQARDTHTLQSMVIPPKESLEFKASRLHIRLPRVPLQASSWRRWASAIGLIALAFFASSVAVRVIATPRMTTAHAESVADAGKSITVAKPAPARSTAQEQASMQVLLNQFIATYQTDGTYNIVIKDLKTGAEATIDPDKSYESASLYKLFVADQIYHMIDTDSLSYTAQAGGGSNNTIQGCLNLMITISDNTCGQALGGILGWGSENPALAAEGFTETDLTTPQQTSARDVGLLFEDLYNGTLNSSASNAAFLALLKNQEVNDRLPAGLPAGTVIAHKTGNLDDVVHDAGIVYGPKTNYLVVVMSGGWNEPDNAPNQFSALSGQLWQYFEQ